MSVCAERPRPQLLPCQSLPIHSNPHSIYLDKYCTHMIPSFVNSRFRPRQPHLGLPVHSTPLLASPSLSPLFPSPYSHTYATANPQLLCHQFLTHSFHHDGGCTPSSHFGSHLIPIRQKIAPSFSCTSRDLFCNPFVLKSIQEWVGCAPTLQTSDRSSTVTTSPDVQTFQRSDVQMRCMHPGRSCGTIRPLCLIAQTTTPLRMYISPMLCSLPLGGRHE